MSAAAAWDMSTKMEKQRRCGGYSPGGVGVLPPTVTAGDLLLAVAGGGSKCLGRLRGGGHGRRKRRETERPMRRDSDRREMEWTSTDPGFTGPICQL